MANTQTTSNPSNILLTIDTSSGIALLRLNRPSKRNALSQSMITELVSTLAHIDSSDSVRAVVLAGSLPDGPFCAGVDISELSRISTADAHGRRFLQDLTDAFARFSKPIIAAVVGFALGGGFEIALACDIIYAADDAIFGLPEVKIGTIPGAGGTQRVTRALGKQKTMELILTGSSINAKELEQSGLVNKTFPRETLLDEATTLATKVASMSGAVTRLAKQAILTSENSHLTEGMAMERTLYYSTFSLEDFREGQAAFLEKRAAKFRH